MKLTFGNIEVGYEVEAKGKSSKCISQVHGATIAKYHPSEVASADAVYTHQTEQSIHVYTADCIPLLFFSTSNEAPVLAAHCGWKGAMHRIAEKSLDFFHTDRPEVVIGPSILGCCFEVKNDFLEAFRKEGHSPESHLHKREKSLFFDLVGFVCDTQLKGAKIHRDFSRCTYCSEPQLPSYRRNRSTDPQIRSWILRKSL